MKRRNSAGFRLRKFYADYLAFPIRYGILFAVVISPIGLVMTWAGFRGKLQPWGDPISFLDALAKVPTQAALTFVVTVIMFSVLRVRF
jgi:hypothetical protein